MEAIEIKGLSKKFGDRYALRGVNLNVRSGEITAVLGPNASGKTTLLKCILGLVLPSEGEVRVNGRNIREGHDYRGDIGYMPQEPSFPENLTPRELLSLLSEVRRRDPAENVSRLVELFGLGDLWTDPSSSSQAERNRR